MSDNKIKVVGYTKKITYDGNIEYRPYSPDLVGLQFTSPESTPTFTMGNFAITTNTDEKLSKIYNTSEFSNFISLENLNLTLQETQTLLKNNTETVLNLDKTKLTNYALFGSLTEFVRVSLENIIITWPASLFMYPITQTDTNLTVNGNTYDDYVYDYVSDTSTFKVNTNFIINSYGINYQTNGTIMDTYNASNDMRNLTVNYLSYVISINSTEYPVIGFSGSTNILNDFIYFTVKGNVFGSQTSNRISYHIKPNEGICEAFFNSLDKFESYLLSRQVTPPYTATFNFPTKSDSGLILYLDQTLTWPVSDGYNLDFDSTAYAEYVTQLVDIASNSDLYTSDLMNRFLVSESISDFDTTPMHLSPEDSDDTGQKVNKTLRIYGREFDEINEFINGISFANTVTYNKNDNTPDKYLKQLASVLGWDLISSTAENGLINNYLNINKSTYSGQTVGLSPAEADIELWRRLILNSPWIWKTKGARSSVEFLLRFIGAPNGLVKFNEYIYKANGPIDMVLFEKLLDANDLDTDLNAYPIDSEGYPLVPVSTDDLYYQSNGGWYRETGGSGSTVDINTGNNPHIGPYDAGFTFINQFNNLIPNFSATTLTSQTIHSSSDVLFLNNDYGTFDNSLTGSTITNVNLTDLNELNIYNRYSLSATVISDPNLAKLVNNCGCPIEGVDNIASLCVSKLDIIPPEYNSCGSYIQSYGKDVTDNILVFNMYQYNQDGSVFLDSGGTPITYQTNYVNSACCSSIGGTPYIYDTISNGIVVNTGFFCKDNSITQILANDKTGTPLSGNSGGVSIQNVLFNDTLNNGPATLNNVILTQVSTDNPKITLNVNTGAITALSGVTAGTYHVTYRICEKRNPSNCSTAVVTVPIVAGEIVYVDADYIVLTYQFIDGRDLDTRTRIVTPNIGQDANTKYVGWAKMSSFPDTSGWSLSATPANAIIDWAGDNQGVGFESVLIDLVKLRAAYPTEEVVVIDCRGFWYGVVGNSPANISAKFYKGGTMIKGGQTVVNGVATQTYQYYNPTATSVTTYNATGKVITANNTTANQVSGERITTFTFNFVTNIGIFNNNDTTTPTV